MHADTPILQRQEAILGVDDEVGDATNAWKALRHLRENRAEMDRVVVVTDMQVWDRSNWRFDEDDRTVREAFDTYREAVAPGVSLYMIDLAAYGDLVTPEGYENVYNVSGWSENVLEFIHHAETPGAVLAEIEAVEPG
jgi:hypothetical protein